MYFLSQIDGYFIISYSTLIWLQLFIVNLMSDVREQTSHHSPSSKWIHLSSQLEIIVGIQS